MDIRKILEKMAQNEPYDMKKEFTGFNGMTADMPALEKVNRYKSYNAKVKAEDKIDMDASDMAVTIYNHAYGHLNQYSKRNVPCYNDKKKNQKYIYELYDAQGNVLRGETLTSFSQTRNHIARVFPLDKSKTNTVNQIWDELERFAAIYHSAGNQVAVPLYFNASRARGYAHYDFGDLTLQKIYQAYKKSNETNEIDENPLRELLNPVNDNRYVDNAVRHCVKWLEQFRVNGTLSFDQFVEANMLEDFCEKTVSGYIPKCFWEEHDWPVGNKPPRGLPRKEDEMLEVLQLINRIIMRRNEKIKKSLGLV